MPIQEFLVYVNNNTHIVRFTGSWNLESIRFLDLMLKGDLSNGRVCTSLFRKPLGGNTLLKANSCRPKHKGAAIPKGEFICAKRACATVEDFNAEAEIISERLAIRGYNLNILKSVR